jgi:hypothetical protein
LPVQSRVRVTPRSAAGAAGPLKRLVIRLSLDNLVCSLQHGLRDRQS